MDQDHFLNETRTNVGVTVTVGLPSEFETEARKICAAQPFDKTEQVTNSSYTRFLFGESTDFKPGESEIKKTTFR